MFRLGSRTMAFDRGVFYPAIGMPDTGEAGRFRLVNAAGQPVLELEIGPPGQEPFAILLRGEEASFRALLRDAQRVPQSISLSGRGGAVVLTPAAPRDRLLFYLQRTAILLDGQLLTPGSA